MATVLRLIGLLLFLGAECFAEGRVPEQPRQWAGTTSNGTFEVVAAPEEQEIPIGKMHRWILTITTSAGEPVFPAKIRIGGGMSSHGHGLPTQPEAIAYGGDGRYLVAGVRFSMAGEWRLMIVVEAGGIADSIDFVIDVDY